MTFLYCLIRLLSFPGAYVRCFWEQIVCRITGTPVEDNRYLRNDELSGHIEHELMATPRAAFAICFVPAFMNAIGALILFIVPFIILFVYETKDTVTAIICGISYWFSCSLMLNSYSLIEDAMNMMEKVYKHGNILQKIFYAPAAAFLYLGAFLERYNITFLLVIITTLSMILLF